MFKSRPSASEQNEHPNLLAWQSQASKQASVSQHQNVIAGIVSIQGDLECSDEL